MAYESTRVPIERSQGDIRRLLADYGASRFAFGEERDEAGVIWSTVTFGHQALVVRMRVPNKPVDEKSIRSKAQRARTKTADDFRSELSEQEGRRIWRVLFWSLKARMVAVEEGVETFAEAFLAHIVNPQTNRTVYEDLTDEGRVDLGRPLAGLLDAPS